MTFHPRLIRGRPQLTHQLIIVIALTSAFSFFSLHAVERGRMLPGVLAEYAPPKKNDSLHRVSISPNGRMVAIVTSSGLLLADLRANKLRRILDGEVISVAFSPDSKTIVINRPSKSNRLTRIVNDIWDISTASTKKSVVTGSRATKFLAYSPRGKYLGWWPGHSHVCIHEAVTLNPVTKITAEKDVRAVSFSPDGDRLAIIRTRERQYAIELRHLSSSRVISGLNGKRRFEPDGGVSFDPVGTALAVGGGKQIDVWDLKTRQIAYRLPVRAHSVHWHSDGSTMICLCREGAKRVVRIIETYTRKEVVSFDTGLGRGTRLVIGKGGTVAAGHDSNRLLIWDLTAPPGQSVVKSASLSRRSIAELWSNLISKDSKGYAAVLQLAQGGEEVVAFLEEKLKPEPNIRAESIRELINNLGVPKFVQREIATQRLVQLGPVAEAEIRGALTNNPPLEVRLRLERIIQILESSDMPQEVLRECRGAVVLGRIGSKRATSMLRRMAAGHPHATKTKVARSSLNYALVLN